MKQITINAETIETLKNAGWKLWEGKTARRMYFNCSKLPQLEVSYYKSGCISDARFEGKTVSHADGYRIKDSKVYIDLADGTLHVQSDFRPAYPYTETPITAIIEAMLDELFPEPEPEPETVETETAEAEEAETTETAEATMTVAEAVERIESETAEMIAPKDLENGWRCEYGCGGAWVHESGAWFEAGPRDGWTLHMPAGATLDFAARDSSEAMERAGRIIDDIVVRGTSYDEEA